METQRAWVHSPPGKKRGSFQKSNSLGAGAKTDACVSISRDAGLIGSSAMVTAGCANPISFDGGLAENKTEAEGILPGLRPIPAHPDRKIIPIVRRKILFRRFPFLAFVWVRFFYYIVAFIVRQGE